MPSAGISSRGLREDRNVIVHRGSMTGSRHSGKTGSPAGTVITPDPAVVRSAIDVTGATRFALALCVWDHLDPGARDFTAVLAGPVLLESLRTGRWQQAEGLAKVQELLAADPQDKANAQVNRWLAMDMGRGPEVIRAEVDAWDTAVWVPKISSMLVKRRAGTRGGRRRDGRVC